MRERSANVASYRAIPADRRAAVETIRSFSRLVRHHGMQQLLRCAPLTGALLVAVAVSASAQTTGAPRVTRMHLSKGSHELTLFDDDRPVATFHVSLGPGGPGWKKQEGDNITPVGRYHVVNRQPSQYRVFLRLDYPNADDRARFHARKASGELPPDATIGGDIGLHGTPQGHKWDAFRSQLRGEDWTAGCIGVQDDEIDRIAAWVRDGTVIDIDD